MKILMKHIPDNLGIIFTLVGGSVEYKTLTKEEMKDNFPESYKPFLSVDHAVANMKANCLAFFLPETVCEVVDYPEFLEQFEYTEPEEDEEEEDKDAAARAAVKILKDSLGNMKNSTLLLKVQELEQCIEDLFIAVETISYVMIKSDIISTKNFEKVRQQIIERKNRSKIVTP